MIFSFTAIGYYYLICRKYFKDMVNPNKLLWSVSDEENASSNLQLYYNWLFKVHHLQFTNYSQLYAWSVNHPAAFWESLLTYFKIEFSGSYSQILSEDAMPETKWFDGINLNYAEHIFGNKNFQNPALIAHDEIRPTYEMSWSTLGAQTASLQRIFKSYGMQIGDRICAYAGNVPETSVAMLACVASGYVWSSCSPDFGVNSVLDRFAQIEPSVLVAVDGYTYNGKYFDRRDEVAQLVSQIKSIKLIIWIPCGNYSNAPIASCDNIYWNDLIFDQDREPQFERVPFNHPIWILYSSGTTGLPKAIVHCQGGMLLEHLKYITFHNDVKKGERFFWYTTTGWMMWNFVHASLLVGATAVLYEGSPVYPEISSLWKHSKEIQINHFGTSAPFIINCMKNDLNILRDYPQEHLRSIGSTGSPLPPEAFEYVYKNIKSDVWLCSMSGGTDVCTAFMGSCIERPVYSGELQCRALGAAIESWNDLAQPVFQEMGELVLTKPMPCMPVAFWNDPDKAKYKASYFDYFPGVWRHGDWIEITIHDGVIIYGRSDATLNRQGVRIGTAEIYNVLNNIKEISDSLIVNLELEGGNHLMPLFISLNSGYEISDRLIKEIRTELKDKCSPRHLPDKIIQVPEIPYTISGKKMESPVKKVLLNYELSKAYNSGAMRNPEAMLFFINNRDAILKTNK